MTRTPTEAQLKALQTGRGAAKDIWTRVISRCLLHMVVPIAMGEQEARQFSALMAGEFLASLEGITNGCAWAIGIAAAAESLGERLPSSPEQVGTWVERVAARVAKPGDVKGGHLLAMPYELLPESARNVLEFILLRAAMGPDEEHEHPSPLGRLFTAFCGGIEF